MTGIPFPPLAEGEFIRRLNRFEAEVRMGGTVERVHVPSPGRLTTAVGEGTPCLLKYDSNPRRKLRYSLYISRPAGHWVVIDSLAANRLMKAVLRDLGLPGLGADRIREVRAEGKWGNSRFDFVVAAGDGSVHLVEVKAVNDAEGGVARFPDAPTVRGARHVQELAEFQRLALGQAWIVFVILRDDARIFQPHRVIDPVFAGALEEAVGAGVQAWAAWSDIGPSGMAFRRWTRWVPG